MCSTHTQSTQPSGWSALGLGPTYKKRAWSNKDSRLSCTSQAERWLPGQAVVRSLHPRQTSVRLTSTVLQISCSLPRRIKGLPGSSSSAALVSLQMVSFPARHASTGMSQRRTTQPTALDAQLGGLQQVRSLLLSLSAFLPARAVLQCCLPASLSRKACSHSCGLQAELGVHPAAAELPPYLLPKPLQPASHLWREPAHAGGQPRQGQPTLCSSPCCQQRALEPLSEYASGPSVLQQMPQQLDCTARVTA